MRKKKWDEIIGGILLAVSLGLLCISVFLCFSGDIWYDELFTLALADQPCGRLISITARDVHPPLYYLMVKLFFMFSGTAGESIGARASAAKLASVFPFFLCFLYSAVKVRKKFGVLTAGVFAFLLAAMPQLAAYTVEARMYGYALFFITAGMLHAYELAEPGQMTFSLRKMDRAFGRGDNNRRNCRNWIFLTLYALAACYTHYYACVAACMIYLYLFIVIIINRRMKEEVRVFLTSGLCCAAGYLPWIVTAAARQMGQVQEHYWIQPLSLRTLGGCVKFLFQPSFTNEKLNIILAVGWFLAYGLLAAALFLRLIKGGRKKGEEDGIGGDRFAAGCMGILIGLVVFGFLASFLIRPIFVYRYMLPAMGAFWLAFAILFSRIKNKKYLFLPLLALLMITGLRNYRAFYGEEMWKRQQMEEAETVLSQIDDDEILIFNFDQTQAVVSSYLENESYLWYGQPEALIVEMYPKIHPLVEGEFSDEAGIAEMKELLQENDWLWFVGSGNARDEIIEKWEKNGMMAEEISSAMIERYWFNLYKITGGEGSLN